GERVRAWLGGARAVGGTAHGRPDAGHPGLVLFHWLRALANYGLHRPVLRATRPRAGHPLGARVAVHTRVVVEPTAPRHGPPHIPAAAGHHLRAGPQRYLQNHALERRGAGLDSGHRVADVLGGGGGEMAAAPTLRGAELALAAANAMSSTTSRGPRSAWSTH